MDGIEAVSYCKKLSTDMETRNFGKRSIEGRPGSDSRVTLALDRHASRSAKE